MLTDAQMERPRYLAKDIDTSGNFVKGDLFVQQYAGNIWYKYENGKFTNISIANLDRYPHLFKKLDWFEERKIEDLPKYLKCGTLVRKVKEWVHEGYGYHFGEHNSFAYTQGWYPATEDEYEKFIKSE